MSQEITNLLRITNFDDLEDSIKVVEDLIMNHSLTEEQEDIILSESVIYGNYFTYEALDPSLKNELTHKAMLDAVLERIDMFIEDPKLVNYKEDIIKQMEEIKQLFIDNYSNEIKCYEYFKQYAVLEYTLKNLM